MEFSNDACKRLTGKVVAAERKFERDLESARAQLDPLNSWENDEIFNGESRDASLKFFGSVLFAWLDEASALQPSIEDLRELMNRILVDLRKEVIEEKWPNLPFFSAHGTVKKDLEFDRALIEWLEARPKWQEYEARILPTLEAAAISGLAGVSSLETQFIREPLERLPPSARRALPASLLKTQAGYQDGLKTPIECWREAYDTIAHEFDQAKLLSDELLDESIPRMVADASASRGWAVEAMGSSIPSAIYNVQFGSRFYPPWRVETFRDSLKGRISYWRGHLLLYPSSSAESGARRGRPPKSEEHQRVAAKVASLGPDWKKSEKLEQLAEWMDSENIQIEKRLKKGVETWLDKVQIDVSGFVKAIEYRLKQRKK